MGRRVHLIRLHSEIGRRKLLLVVDAHNRQETQRADFCPDDLLKFGAVIKYNREVYVELLLYTNRGDVEQNLHRLFRGNYWAPFWKPVWFRNPDLEVLPEELYVGGEPIPPFRIMKTWATA